MRIVFFGTPEFAVGSLEALYENGFEIAGVVTAMDKPAGRGMKLRGSAVKEFAQKHSITVLQPANLKGKSFLSALAALNADVHVVVAFRMLPEKVWNMPPGGTINVHASLLPKYRGAAPINHAIINGEKETGVTTFKLKHAIDTGNMLLQSKVAIMDEDNAGSLHDKLMKEGGRLLVDTLKQLEQGTLNETEQVMTEGLREAPKIFPKDCLLDFGLDVKRVHNKVRGLSPYPGAYFIYRNKILKVYKSKVESASHPIVPGTVQTDYKTFIKVACQNGFLHLLEVQSEGRKRMQVNEWLHGLHPAD